MRTRSSMVPSLPALPALIALGIVVIACSKSADPPAPATTTGVSSKPGATAVPAVTATVAATASAAPAATGPGPIATIPAGKLISGTACGDHPRLPGEELAGEAMDLGGFDIDVYPYPNDPAQPPKTSVSRDDAKRLCEARGRRLCTEVEWERACKGPSNTRYEYGDRFDPKVCPTGFGTIAAPAGFEKCKSAFGVHAMHGFAWEWTASDWKRGKDEGKVALRGGYGNQPYAHMRCSGTYPSSPTAAEENVGFRCCGGTANTKEIVIPADDPAPSAMAEEATVDAALAARLQRALVNGKYKDEGGVTSTFTKVWRWHPAAKEEIVIARYESKGEGGAVTVQPFIVRLCDKSVQLIGQLKGPVEKMDAPTVKDDAPGTAMIHVEAGSNSGDVKLSYQFAQVALNQPAWVTAAAPAASAAPAAR